MNNSIRFILHPSSLILLLFFLVACTTPPPTPTPQPTLPPASPVPTPAERTILAFGDSLTEGLGVERDKTYPVQLASKLRSEGYPYTVINGGISGETTSSALSRVEWMLTTKPAIVIVETGGNDALRGVDLTLTEQNIDQIITQFEDSGAIVVLAGLQIIQNLGEDYITQFKEMYPRLAEKHPNVIFIPFFLEGVAANPELNQADFIHPTGEGYTVVVDHIYPFILEAIKQDQARLK